MFEKLFKRQLIITRHTQAPYAEERRDYLVHCAQRGYTPRALIYIARELLWIAYKLKAYPDLRLSLEEIKKAARGWRQRRLWCGKKLIPRCVCYRFIQVALPWLRYLGCLRVPRKPAPFLRLQEAYVYWMEHERGLSPATIKGQSAQIKYFLSWYVKKRRPIRKVHIRDIDSYLLYSSKRGWSRRSLKDAATALRLFFRYLGQKGQAPSSLAFAIQNPRIFQQESLPLGPSWPDIRRLVSSAQGSSPKNIRDKAILLVLSVYGLRACELEKLTLDDIDWEHEQILIHRAKRRRPQVFPLVAEVGNALLRYLQKVRPKSSYRQLFLSLKAPIKPLGRPYEVTSKRLLKLGIKLEHYGPHALRHACARHLLSEGFSLKHIGDHLGHRRASSTQIYAKVDLRGLKEVARYDLGGLL